VLNQAPGRPVSRPWAFLVTFACYGARLHGNGLGSVDREHNLPNSRYLPENWRREAYERRMMREAPFRLDAARRRVVLEALREACRGAGGMLHAAHVRTNHVHAVVESEAGREEVLRRLKARSSAELRKLDPARRKRWARHGSVRGLCTAESLETAVEYVLKDQGEPLEAWENPQRHEP